ncbi:hypothetical protein Aperf_G00000125122 [Anoplocephala perfoliata]
MEERPTSRFARLLDLPEYGNEVSWLPVDNKTSSKLPTAPVSSSSCSNASINGNKGDLLIDLPDNSPGNDSKINHRLSPPTPDMSTLPALEEVTFPLVDIEEVKKPNKPNKPKNFLPLKRSYSIPVSIALPNYPSSSSNAIETPQKPLTLLALSKLGHSHSLNRPTLSRRAGISFERHPLERRFMTAGDIIPLPSCHPVKVENIVESLGLNNAYGSFPEFPDFPATNAEKNREIGSVCEKNKIEGSSAISIDEEACAQQEIISPSQSQPDVTPTSPIIRSRSLTILPKPGVTNDNDNGQISPDRTSEISPYNHSPVETEVASGGESHILMTDDAGWVKSSKFAKVFRIIPTYFP